MTRIDINTDQIWNAGDWLKTQLDTPPGESIREHFEKQFNCLVIHNFETKLDYAVEFNSEKDLTMFLLKWSK